VVALIEALGARGGLAVAGEVRVARINGGPGLIVPSPDGPQTIIFDTMRRGASWPSSSCATPTSSPGA
jgi:hypothetical protein